MSHMIDMSNGRANMAYTGQTPWHKLGAEINPDATIEEWRIAAGLDWSIEKRPIAYGVKNDAGAIIPKTIDDRFAHVRSDTQECIGMGSNRFNLMQPGDILEFYRDLVDGSRFSIETAGSLKGGAKIWALAKCNLDLTIGTRDIIKPYLLLATANDGTMSTVADFTTVRVVCNNTLTMAVGSNGRSADLKIPHSRSFDASAVKAELGLVDGQLESFADSADRLSQTRADDKQVLEFFTELYAKKDEHGNIENLRTVESTVKKLFNLYRRGPGSDLDTADGTLWGAVNAVTRHVDFDTKARSNENRFNASQFGIGAELKARAFKEAVAIAA